jgi:hypothetical protein
MRKTLTEKTHRKLLRMYRVLGKEICWRSRFGYGRTLEILEAMHELLIQRNSWEGRKSGKS